MAYYQVAEMDVEQKTVSDLLVVDIGRFQQLIFHFLV
jgi:hypothetical protein